MLQHFLPDTHILHIYATTLNVDAIQRPYLQGLNK